MHPSLLLLADGRLPTGGHAYSAGVEWAAGRADVRDLATMERFGRGRLATTGITDAAFAARTAAWDGGDDLLAVLDHEYDVRTASPRLRHVSRRLGRQFTRTARHIWPDERWAAVDGMADGVHQPIVLGLATAAAGGTPGDAALLAVHHLAGAISSASIRLLGLDPIATAATQARLVAELSWVGTDAAGWAETAPAELPATSSSVAEVLAEAHGHQDARLFVA